MRGLKSKLLAVTTFLLLFTIAFVLSETAPDQPKEFITYQFQTKKGNFNYKLIEAITPKEKEQGLQEIGFIPTSHGMIFFLNCKEEPRFWMKDTFLPLDLIFLDQDMKVTDIKPELKPDTEDYITSHLPACYAVEINAKEAAFMRLDIGDSLIKIN